MTKLIVYYSYVGHTKMVADQIRDKLSCDVVELKPVKEFSQDYEKVVDEYRNNSIEDDSIELQKLPVNLEEYDEIILGSSVWWYTVTPPVASFLKENDLTGKTIHPFITNAGWIGHTVEDIQKLCPHSDIKEALNVKFTTDHTENKILTSQDTIDEWINNL